MHARNYLQYLHLLIFTANHCSWGSTSSVASTQTFNHYQTSTTHSLPRKRLCGTCQDLNGVLRQHHSFIHSIIQQLLYNTMYRSYTTRNETEWMLNVAPTIWAIPLAKHAMRSGLHPGFSFDDKPRGYHGENKHMTIQILRIENTESPVIRSIHRRFAAPFNRLHFLFFAFLVVIHTHKHTQIHTYSLHTYSSGFTWTISPNSAWCFQVIFTPRLHG